MNNIIFKTTLIKGEAGNNIQSIEKTATSGAVDTYTITLTDGSTTTFNVTNGSNIASITLTGSSGLVDTYTVTLTDGSTTTFEVRNGQDYTVPTNGMIYYDDDNALPEGYEVAGNFTDEILAGEASGNVASFIGLDNTIVKELVATIEPVQAGSGTPSPTNVRAISGFTECTVINNGKNLFVPEFGEQGYINNSGVVVSANDNWASNYIEVSNIAYTVSANANWYNLGVAYFGESKGFISRNNNNNLSTLTFTPPTNAKYVRIWAQYTGVVMSAQTCRDRQIQLEIGSSATAYKAPKTAELTFGTTAGTVYGGTLDFTTGKLTVDKALVNWQTVGIAKNSQSAENYLYYIYSGIDVDYNGDLVCSHAPQVASMPQTTLAVCAYSQFSVVYVNFLDNIGTNTVAGLRQYCINNNVQLVYQLKTPIEYTLPTDDLRTFEGINNVTASTGTMQKVVYFKSSIIADIYERMLALENA